jgi:hypothetical protein
MKHEKTFEAINKLKDIEIELHRLKNALEMANKSLDAQRTWVGLTDDERTEITMMKWWDWEDTFDLDNFMRIIEAKLKEKNNV